VPTPRASRRNIPTRREWGTERDIGITKDWYRLVNTLGDGVEIYHWLGGRTAKQCKLSPGLFLSPSLAATANMHGSFDRSSHQLATSAVCILGSYVTGIHLCDYRRMRGSRVSRGRRGDSVYGPVNSTHALTALVFKLPMQSPTRLG
jgi:hypothetical protein